MQARIPLLGIQQSMLKVPRERSLPWGRYLLTHRTALGMTTPLSRVETSISGVDRWTWKKPRYVAYLKYDLSFLKSKSQKSNEHIMIPIY